MGVEGLSSRPLDKGGISKRPQGLILVLKIRGGGGQAFRIPTLDPPLGNWVC